MKFMFFLKMWCAEAAEVEGSGGGGGSGGVKRLVYRQLQLRRMTLVKSLNTTASFRTAHFRSFHKM